MLSDFETKKSLKQRGYTYCYPDRSSLRSHHATRVVVVPALFFIDSRSYDIGIFPRGDDVFL